MNQTWVVLALATLFKSDFAVQNHLEAYYSSLPVPAYGGNVSYIVIAHVAQSGPIKGRKQILFDKIFVSKIRYPDTALYFNSASASTYNIPVTNGEIGSIDRSNVLSVKEYLNAKKEYQILISKVLEKGWLFKSSNDLKEQSETARELLDCWDILKEDRLMPFYEREGSQFLNWMYSNSK
jgi:hypothetical protein